ncbi:MAG: response regulator [Chloroflexi bacterium]|nr:response regulator [Chloroflexota bacterium]MBU1747266.1 response regulator [Chloroflexota bacterium]MBU1877723.1 response regulator [Chloroflexota bacterium]
MNARVLLVDDAAFMRRMMRDILTRQGLDIVGEAPDGESAIERYVELQPDLVLMDITMPGMNGIEAVREILAHDPQARIVMCSAMGQRDLVMESLDAGARDFIVKPFYPDRVLATIRQVLEHSDSSPSR